MDLSQNNYNFAVKPNLIIPMNRFKYLIILTSLLACSYNVFADSTASTSNKKTEILHERNPGDRPKAPSRIFIECRYGIGHMEFSIPENIYGMTVNILREEACEFSCYVTSEEPYIDIPTFSGEYTVQCVTDDGSIFSGILQF